MPINYITYVKRKWSQNASFGSVGNNFLQKEEPDFVLYFQYWGYSCTKFKAVDDNLRAFNLWTNKLREIQLKTFINMWERLQNFVYESKLDNSDYWNLTEIHTGILKKLFQNKWKISCSWVFSNGKILIGLSFFWCFLDSLLK